MRTSAAPVLVLLACVGGQIAEAVRVESGGAAEVDAEGDVGLSAGHEVLIEGDHAAGLEAEHHFELVSHDLSNASGWDVTGPDEAVLDTIITKLNPPGADSKFAWKNERAGWTFGLVKLTAQTAKGSLALHMLHRHGLAPLIASRAGAKFDAFVKGRATARSGASGLELFVQSQEEFEEVKAMRTLLERLSLGALRNLHSYDHQWSVDEWAGKVPGCSQQSGATCILQAGTSAAAWNFLSQHGFTESSANRAMQGFQGIMKKLNTGATGLPRSAYGKYLTPGHTGKMTPHVQVEMDNGRWEGGKIVGKYYIIGAVAWEDGGVTTGIRVPIPRADGEKLYGRNLNADKRRYLENRLEQWMESQTATHKTFMRTHRLKVWTNEQAEFWEMYPRYSKATSPKDGFFSGWGRVFGF